MFTFILFVLQHPTAKLLSRGFFVSLFTRHTRELSVVQDVDRLTLPLPQHGLMKQNAACLTCWANDTTFAFFYFFLNWKNLLSCCYCFRFVLFLSHARIFQRWRSSEARWNALWATRHAAVPSHVFTPWSIFAADISSDRPTLTLAKKHLGGRLAVRLQLGPDCTCVQPDPDTVISQESH